MTTFRDGAESPTLMERHQKIGQLLAEAFPANHPALLDWAAVGFALKRLQPETQGELAAAKRGVVVPMEPTKEMLEAGYAAAAFPRDPEICVAMYKAMLSAAPQQNTAQEDQSAER